MDTPPAEKDDAARPGAQMPRWERDPELVVAVERERYDAQILAALVSP